MKLRRHASVAAILSALALLLPTTPANAAEVSLAGTITDHTTGIPIANACATIFNFQQVEVASGCADANGNYQILDVPPGYYRVRFTATGYIEQWAADRPTFDLANSIYVAGTQLGAALRTEAGTVAGTLLEHNGEPSADASVQISDAHSNWQVQTRTGTDGTFLVTNMPVGDYIVWFRASSGQGQCAYQKEDCANADRIAIRDDEITTVNDTLLPPGAMTVVVTDSTSGAPVLSKCVYARSSQQETKICDDTGAVITFPDLPGGTYTLDVRPKGTHYPTSVTGVVVSRGQTTKVNASVRPGAAIRTTVVDAQTNQPVANTCVYPFEANTPGVLRYAPRYCTDATGVLTIGPLEPRTYMLLADPRDTVHGMQWVGWNGGVGDQLAARVVPTEVGQVTAVPAIRLDPAGAIIGTVRDKASGTPVPRVCAYPYALDPTLGAEWGANCTGANGEYRIDGLGPYAWPVQFAETQGLYAWQWSGGAVDRFAARRINVAAGGTATADADLIPGGVITGRAYDAGGSPTTVSLHVFSARTGDYAAPFTSNGGTGGGAYHVRSLHTQDVKIKYVMDKTYWYEEATDFASATPVACTAGQAMTLDLHAS